MKKLNYTSAERVDLVPLNVRALNLKSGEFQSSIVVPAQMRPFFCIKINYFSTIDPVGHAASQAPQSIHSSGLTT